MINPCSPKQNTPSPCGRVRKGAAYIKPSILVVELDLEGGIAQMVASKIQSVNPSKGVDIMYERDTKMGIFTDDFGNGWIEGAK